MVRVSLIIPTYNEAKNLPFLVEEIFSVLDKTKVDLELIVVDDNSPDGTGQVAEDLSKKFPIKIVHRAGKLGLGSAVREGFEHSDRPILGVMDADLSHDPKSINEMIDSLKDYDVVLGSRFEKGSTVEQWKWWRKIISKIGVSITCFLTGVKDPLSGFFFLKREVIAGVPLTTMGYKILLEILIKAKYRAVKEIPFQFRIRKFSTSKLDTKEYWLFFKQIIGYSWYKFLRLLSTNKYLVAILILSMGLLLYHVAYRTFWMDETMVLNYLNYSPLGFLSYYWHVPDNHPPLYYFLVLLVSRVLPWTELTIRLVSMLAGLGMVWLVYTFMHRVTENKKTALVAAFFTAFSSYFVLISQMARYHSLAAFFSLAAFYFFYKLFVEGYQKRVWYWYLVMLILVGYTDYPHFIYVVLITNVLFLYRFIRRRSITSFVRWVMGQLAVALVCAPMLWLVYNRIVFQGDGGWHNTNLLANSWVHIATAILFHLYTFFFGENILPWNYVIFGSGCVVFLGMAVGFVQALRKKIWSCPQGFIIGLSMVLIILNTLFMNVADPRYNFIVYPKFSFVAYPLWIMSFVLCLTSIRSKKIKISLFGLWALVALSGLVHFYKANNYLNASYFRTFEQFEYVRDNSTAGQYLMITPNAGPGVYDFYKEKYFKNLSPLASNATTTLSSQAQVWFFATGSDSSDETFSPDSNVPEGFNIVKRFDSVPLDPMLQKYKEKILHRPSYTYKYSVFLLEKK